MLAAFAAVPRLSAVAATAAKLRIDVMFPTTFAWVHADRHFGKGYAGGATCRCAHHGPVTKCHLKSATDSEKPALVTIFIYKCFKSAPKAASLTPWHRTTTCSTAWADPPPLETA